MRRPAIRLLVVGLLLASSRPAAAAEAYRSVILRGVPFVPQRPDFCGEACVEMAVRRLGFRLTQDDVFALAGIPPRLGRGALARELRRAIVKLGFDPGRVWFRVSRRRPAPALEAQFRSLHADLAAGVPSIVCSYYSTSPRTTEHFRLVVGYDARSDEVIYHEPAEQRGAYRRMSRTLFVRLWPLRYLPDEDVLIRIPLRAPRTLRLPASPEANRRLADRAQQIMQARQRAAAGR